MSPKLKTKVSGDVLSVSLQAQRVDAGTAAALKEELKFDLEPSVKRAEVDLGGVEFIDSSGIGLLLSIYRKLPQDGAEVTLKNVDPAVQSVLELLRLHRIFKLA